MSNRKIFWSLCWAFLWLHTLGFSLELPREQRESTASPLSHAQTHLSAKKKRNQLVYYLYVQDFIDSMIAIPTSNVSTSSTTIDSKYLAGRAPIYNRGNKKFGVCSASFLCMKNQAGIFTDISNYLTVDNGLIVSWLTPSTLVNLELDSIIHGMVTECLVTASTKVGFNPFYGQQFNMVVSSDTQKIYFKLTPLKKGRK